MKTQTEPTDYVMVTDWDKVDADDFYLTDKQWAENLHPDNLRQAKAMQADGKLYIGYVVAAVNYVIYHQMDARQIFINEDGDEIMSCEGEVIGNSHKEHFEYSF